MNERTGPFWDAVEGRAPMPPAAATRDQFEATHDLNVRFLRPVRPGRLTAKGRVGHRDGDLAHLDASLYDGGGAVVATASALARVIPLSAAGEAV